MKRTAILAALAAVLAMPAAAQEPHRFFDSQGRFRGLSPDYNAGSATSTRVARNYDARGRYTGTSETRGGVTRNYDATGRYRGSSERSGGRR